MNNPTTELIIVEQLPIITERFRIAGEEVARRVAEANALVCTEESKKVVKNARADLRKEQATFAEQFKAVEAQILAPWNAVKAAYKEYIVTPYADGDVALKEKIDAIEDEQKRVLREEVVLYFNEYAMSKGIGIVSFVDAGIKVGVSDNATNLKKQAKAFIDRASDELALIETQEHKGEIMVEYKRTFNAAQAITTVADRYKAIEAENARLEAIKERRTAEAEVINRVEAVAAPLAPPVAVEPVEVDTVMKVTFTVTAPKSKLRELKKFLNDGGYEFE